MAGKYFWLKLKEDFFESEDMLVVESMPSGKDFIIFYLKLLCKSIRNEGNLKLTEEIPYNDEMLATVTRTDINVVKQAIQVFSHLRLIEILDDGTYYMNKVENMIGSAASNNNALRQQRYRDRQKKIQPVTESVTENNERLEIRDKRLDNNNIDQEFDALWELYPKKQGKKKAKQYYLAARKKGTTFEDVRDGIERYRAYIETNKTDFQYVKQGSTFFSQQAWDDEWTSSSKPKDDFDWGGVL